MFDSLLRTIVEETGGGLSAVLMGYDGIAIANYTNAPETDLQTITIEYANILKEIRKAAEVLNTGEMEEVDIRTSQYHVIMRAVSSEYFVALTLAQDGNFGKGRYLLRRDLLKLQEALL